MKLPRSRALVAPSSRVLGTLTPLLPPPFPRHSQVVSIEQDMRERHRFYEMVHHNAYTTPRTSAPRSVSL